MRRHAKRLKLTMSRVLGLSFVSARSSGCRQLGGGPSVVSRVVRVREG